MVAGLPGSGKTIFAQQLLFHHAKNGGGRVLYVTTLSEPALKVMRYLQRFSFYDPELFEERILYRDVDAGLRSEPPSKIAAELMRLVNEHQPELLVIDSFKALRDIGGDTASFRRLCDELAVELAASQCTTLLLGEYEQEEVASGAKFAVGDGIFYLDSDEETKARSLKILKLRGRDHEMGRFSFVLSADGMRLLAPALTLRREAGSGARADERLEIGVPGIDEILGGGGCPWLRRAALGRIGYGQDHVRLAEPRRRCSEGGARAPLRL